MFPSICLLTYLHGYSLYIYIVNIEKTMTQKSILKNMLKNYVLGRTR